jgi:ParB family chromosome partitioning protein
MTAKAPLSAFIEDPNQPRMEFDDPEFEVFVEDIRERGILQPIMVQALPDGMLLIRFGARRYRAAVRLGLTSVPYVVIEDERQLDDYAQVSENEMRKGLQPLELALFIQRKLSAGEKKKAIAAKLQMDASAVTHLLALVDGPPLLLELYQSRKCRLPIYLYQLRKLHEKHPALVERRCSEVDFIDRSALASISEEVEAHRVTIASMPGSLSTSIGSQLARPDCELQSGDIELGASSDPGSQAFREALPPAPPTPPKIKQPRLFGKHQGREVTVLLTRRPSRPGFAFVRLDDRGEDIEIELRVLSLTMLSDGEGYRG